MRPAYVIASNVVSSLGLDMEAHWKAISSGRTGIRRVEDSSLSATPFYGSLMDASQWQRIHEEARNDGLLSPFEQMALFSARKALDQCEERPDPKDTLFILSTTKGNIEWLGEVPDERILLSTSAALIAKALGVSSRPVVITHACVSGVVALVYALRSLQAGRYKHAIVTGADRFTRFVLSGFQSFQAIADEPCRPFDAHRKGINLGEAAATIILSVDEDNLPLARMISGSSSNDANHISGPSRTGEELALAISRTLETAGVAPHWIDMISAHGTATLYNDEMEAKAFAHAGVAQAQVHSLKGYMGHTLGAAGVVESAMIVESLRRQQLIASAGFDELGVSEPLRITTNPKAAEINYALKTASGFGGCNATALWASA